MGFLELIVILVIVLIIGGVIFGIVYGAGGSKGGGDMSCGGCGYAVRGLEGLNCPECGADLRQVGINRGQNTSKRGFMVVMTVVGVAYAFIVFGFLMFNVKSQSSQPAAMPAIQVQPAPPPPPIVPILPEDESGDSDAPGDADTDETPADE